MKGTIKKWLNEIFIDGLSGMALGLFSTLIIGTIIAQIGSLIGGSVGNYLVVISNVAKTLTGLGLPMRYRVRSMTCTPRSMTGPPPERDLSENQPPGLP